MKQKNYPNNGYYQKYADLKKGNPANIENYRPISNLSSGSKNFEKLILLRIQNLEKLHKIDLQINHSMALKESTVLPQRGYQSRQFWLEH